MSTYAGGLLAAVAATDRLRDTDTVEELDSLGDTDTAEELASLGAPASGGTEATFAEESP